MGLSWQQGPLGRDPNGRCVDEVGGIRLTESASPARVR